MSNTNRDLALPNPLTYRLFSSAQLEKIDKLHIPTIVRFMLADRHDTKFINTTLDKWEFKYAGLKNNISFEEFDDFEKKLIKYILICYIQINSPSSLFLHFNHIRKTLNHLKKEKDIFSYGTLKSLLIHISKEENSSPKYYTVKFFLNLMISEGFEFFEETNENELDILERPSQFNSNLYYQQSEDSINKPIITMIQNGFTRLNSEITEGKSIPENTLKNSSILGIIYTTGMRPVQLAKLTVEDIKEDTCSETGKPLRFSILVPYAKQGRYSHSKIAIKLPEEVASVIFQYIKQFALSESHQLFDLGDNAVTYCTNAINEQLFAFSPIEYQHQVLNGELIQIKYTSSQFRHHVAYSMALGGASAEDIAYILGHSSLVTARHYITASPNLAQIRAMALGSNLLYQQMIAMLMTGDIISPEQDVGKNVVGFINNTIHTNIGKCGYKTNCFLEPVRSCYGCVYFHPYQNGNHQEVLNSVQNELESIIQISDSTYNSSNPLITIHEATKFEINSVIKRCELNNEVNYARG